MQRRHLMSETAVRRQKYKTQILKIFQERATSFVIVGGQGPWQGRRLSGGVKGPIFRWSDTISSSGLVISNTFAFGTNSFCNLDKYILQVGQILFVIWTNTRKGRGPHLPLVKRHFFRLSSSSSQSSSSNNGDIGLDTEFRDS